MGASTDTIGMIGVVTDLSARVRADDARRLLVRQATSTIEEERRRIACELHDETGQSLMALLVGLQAIEDACAPGETTVLARRLRDLAARTLEEVGRLSRGLHPGILEDLGFTAAVSRHAGEFGERHRLSVDLRIEGLGEGGELPLAVQSTLYRTFQEALTNVAKHAAATRVEIRLRSHDAAVELRVRDDGAGFDAGALARSNRRRLGLAVMRERAALLGGSVTVVSRPGGGTTVAARYPLGTRARARQRPQRRPRTGA
jgi:two-component system NarL family sensor kinase